MLRLIVVMGVLMLAVTWVLTRSPDDEAASAPEQVYREQTDKVRELETQLQGQAARQLEQIDGSPEE